LARVLDCFKQGQSLTQRPCSAWILSFILVFFLLTTLAFFRYTVVCGSVVLHYWKRLSCSNPGSLAYLCFFSSRFNTFSRVFLILFFPLQGHLRDHLRHLLPLAPSKSAVFLLPPVRKLRGFCYLNSSPGPFFELQSPSLFRKLPQELLSCVGQGQVLRTTVP